MVITVENTKDLPDEMMREITGTVNIPESVTVYRYVDSSGMAKNFVPVDEYRKWKAQKEAQG